MFKEAVYLRLWRVLGRSAGRDKHFLRYVSLEILAAEPSLKSTEASILQLPPRCGGSVHQGQQSVPLLLDQFSIPGLNGRHTCLVQDMKPASCSIAASKEDSINFSFPVKIARSIAAQLIMGVAYLHPRGVCHGVSFNLPSLSSF